MITLVFLLEEPSAEEMLKGILPKILPDYVIPRFIVFQGKQDLEKQLVRKLRLWRAPNSQFLVLRDQDSGDCRVIKQNLLDKCREAHKTETIVRIACQELESFYLGDLQAVDHGLETNNLSRLQDKRKYREPDNLAKPARELMALTKNIYQKVSGSRAISRHMNLENNRSHSFNVLIKTLEQLIVNCENGNGNT